MMRALLCLVPWMAIGTAAAFQGDGPRPAEAVFLCAEGQRIPAYRVGGECYVAAEALDAVGWKCKFDKFQAEVTTAGRKAKVAFRVQAGKQVIPLGEASKLLGGVGVWQKRGTVFEVFGSAKLVTYKDGVLLVDSGLPFLPKISVEEFPARLVIDFEGLLLDSMAKVAMNDGAKVGAKEDGLMRITIPIGDGCEAAPAGFEWKSEFKAPIDSLIRRAAKRPQEKTVALTNANDIRTIGAKNETGSKSPVQSPNKNSQNGVGQSAKNFEITITNGAEQESQVPIPEVLESEPFDREPPKWNGTRPCSVASIQVVGESDAGAIVVLKLNGKLSKAPLFRRADAETFEVVLPGALPYGLDSANPRSRYLSGFSAVTGPDGLVLRFGISEKLGMQVGTPPKEIHLAIIKPKNPGGSLAGKTIVVDAGHGGTDTGAKSPDKQTLEKNLTLSIASIVATRLSHEGATVVMTRKTDILIPLKERPEIANRNGAAFFVSVHINSNVSANSSSGGITFYHAQDPVSMLLAECIQAEIAKVSGLPTFGAWSDTRIYDSGFAVLRYSLMPAVLIELGFINNSFDRNRMKTKEFQEAAASAIVKGLKVYLGHGQE